MVGRYIFDSKCSLQVKSRTTGVCRVMERRCVEKGRLFGR